MTEITVFRVTRTLKLPEEIFIRTTMEVVNGAVSSQKTARATFLARFLGDASTLLSILNRRLPELGLVRSDCIETSWIHSVLFWTDIQVGTSEKVLLERNETLMYIKRKSDYVLEPISRTGLESIWRKMIELETPSAIAFNPYGGMMAKISSTATPFPYRAGNLSKIQYDTDWGEDSLTNWYMKLTRKLYRFMTPFVSKNPRQSFFNYRDIELRTNLSQNQELC